MTQGEYLQQFKALTDGMLAITAAKNSDYGGGRTAFKNFEMIENVRSNIRTEDGIFVRMTDKFTRIGNLMEREAVVADEKIEDTLLDLANYSLILLIYLRSKQPPVSEVLPKTPDTPPTPDQEA